MQQSLRMAGVLQHAARLQSAANWTCWSNGLPVVAKWEGASCGFASTASGSASSSSSERPAEGGSSGIDGSATRSGSPVAGSSTASSTPRVTHEGANTSSNIDASATSTSSFNTTGSGAAAATFSAASVKEARMERLMRVLLQPVSRTRGWTGQLSPHLVHVNGQLFVEPQAVLTSMLRALHVMRSVLQEVRATKRAGWGARR
jgi:hypothetical protein